MPLADETALGLLETHGLVAGIEAADAMLKTAEVRLVAMEQTIPALITVKVVGDVASVTASVAAGRAAAERVGRVVSAHVIPRPADEVRAMMRLDDDSTPERRAATPMHGGTAAAESDASPPSGRGGSARGRDTSASGRAPSTAGRSPSPPGTEVLSAADQPDYHAMTVRELRAAAREIPDFPLQGREVARARKSELIEHLIRHRGA